MYGFAISFFISYFFDCLDGHYARKYNMVTKFGDYYDHIKDITIWILIFLIIMSKYKTPKKYKLLSILILFFFLYLCQTHLGCQEKKYNKDESDTLDFMKKSCFFEPDDALSYTRHFGCGTFIVITILVVIWVNKNRKN